MGFVAIIVMRASNVEANGVAAWQTRVPSVAGSQLWSNMDTPILKIMT
jgi:hypothetical protein